MTGAIDLSVIVAYFVVVIGFGAWAARHSRGTRDFFLGGQRFAWWMVAFSCVATVVGSYSFVKYSSAGFRYGLSSSQTYLNDWFWMPLWMFGWLPLVYYAGITSVPEYFDRRFGRRARLVATLLLLVYLVGYLGINFFTMGKALSALVGWPLLLSAGLAAVVCGVYTSHGGQTAVIFTDLLQGVLLLVAGLGLFVAGLVAVGGPSAFWSTLEPVQRGALAPFNRPPDFNFVGIFWQDGMAGGIAFYFMNQGILMRFLSARSVGDARKAAATVILLLMPLAAVAVSGAGWIGRAMVSRGTLAADTAAGDIFVTVADRVLPVGFFGLVVAALVAALMSTADTLINAIATVSVNDLWRPLRARAGKAPGERATLRAARLASAGATVIGFALVPVFASFGSIYRAHGAFTAAITPPLAVALVLGFSWKRFSPRAALLVMVGGSLLIALSLRWPEMVAPLAHGIDLEAGGKGYSYIRALFGLMVCTGLGVGGALLWPDRRELPGTLRLGPVIDKMRVFKRGEPRLGRTTAGRFRLALQDGEARAEPEPSRPRLRLAPEEASRLGLEEGDLATLREDHWLRGGYQGFTGRVELDEGPPGEIRVPTGDLSGIRLREGVGVVVRRLL